MPNGVFASYDLNQDGAISPDEWAQFYDNAGGPIGGEPPTDVAPAGPFDLEDFINKVSSGTFTDDDMLAFSNWYMGQQMGQQAGQLDLANRTLDYQLASLGLNEQQLEVAKQEIEFQQGPYWEWYTEEYFPRQQERDRMETDLARYNLDIQKQLGQFQVDEAGIRQQQAKEYALAQFYNTESSKYGADAARYQYLQMTNGLNPNGAAQGQNQYIAPRTAQSMLGAY